MGYRCKNCGQTAAPGDVSCWHCGWRFPQPIPGQLAIAAEAPARPTRPPEVTLYATLTAGLAIIALSLMLGLGRQPFIQVTSGDPLPPDWQAITDSQQRFTLNLPFSWVWLDSQEEQQQAVFMAQQSGGLDLEMATRPLGQLVNDLVVTFLATSAPAPDGALLVVARSALLNRLTAQQAIAAVQQSRLIVVEAAYAPDFDKSHVAITLDVDGQNGTWRCEQQFVNGPDEAWLLAICAPVAEYGRIQATVRTILSSYQVLRPG